MSPRSPDRPASLLADRVTAELARQLGQQLEPGLYLVATPIGNLGDISLRALMTLSRADLICCEDTRHSRTLLDHFGIQRPLRSYHEHNAQAERPRILAALAAGQVVALVSDAGTPLISDPGYKLVRAALEGGFCVTSIPGASAVLAGLAVAGLPTDCFLFAGFLPTKDNARRARLAELVDTPATLVFFEAPSRLASSLQSVAAAFAGRDVAVARELTKRFEEVRRGTAAELGAWAASAGDIKGEIVILIGPPPPAAAVADSDIAVRLEPLLSEMSLRDAARVVADDLGIAKSRVYDIGLKLKGGR
jgi:16S rRNA (cytidine1402-2'-O)-methyltransferase